jgi:murein L,D-transpeptidase YcbB/YkuD
MYCSRIFSFRLIYLFWLILLVGQGCKNVPRQKIAETPAAAAFGKPDAPVEVMMPGDSLDPVYKGLKTQVADFYIMRNKRPIWRSRNGLSPSGDSLLRFIAGIRYYGLLPANYHFKEIADNMGQGITNTARLDALMTDAFMSITKDLMFGRLMHRNTVSDSIAWRLLCKVAENGGVWQSFRSVEPQLKGYQQLKGAVKAFLDSLPLSQRPAVLQNSGEISDSLNARVQAIEVNLERWRSETQFLASRFLFVNIPAFMLYVISDDTVIMESRVIVGKPETETPELTSAVECLVTYPYWHVPRKIAIEEYLPIIQRDTSFLSRNNFDVLDRSGSVVDPDTLPWQGFNKDYFPVSLRQRDGPENSLGILKFVFDNPYAVFLHDTNARRLFRSDVRAFSHGCIRMEKAVELSHYLLMGDTVERSKLIDRYLEESLRHTVNLPSSVPIYIRYFTVAVRGNSLVFYEDIYHKDDAIMKDLYNEDINDL